MILNVYKAYKQNLDKDDFVDSVTRLFKKAQKQKVKEEVKVAEPEPERDAFIIEIEALAKFGKFDSEVVAFCKDLYAKKDRKLTSVF